jgi:hypothetical protein
MSAGGALAGRPSGMAALRASAEAKDTVVMSSSCFQSPDCCAPCEANVIAEACVGDKWLELDRDSLQGRPGIPVQVGIIGYGSVKNYHLPAALSTHISVYPF